jgi:hypothetical protein
LVEIALERVESGFPESAVVIEPLGGLADRLWRELASNEATFLAPHDDAGVFEHREVFHETRERHAERLGELASRGAAVGELRDDGPAGRIGECGEDTAERVVSILNHMVQ